VKVAGIVWMCVMLSFSMVYAREWNVLDFGAKGDGITDDTQAFQKALNEAGRVGGGIVHVPRVAIKYLATL